MAPTQGADEGSPAHAAPVAATWQLSVAGVNITVTYAAGAEAYTDKRYVLLPGEEAELRCNVGRGSLAIQLAAGGRTWRHTIPLNPGEVYKTELEAAPGVKLRIYAAVKITAEVRADGAEPAHLKTDVPCAVRLKRRRWIDPVGRPLRRSITTKSCNLRARAWAASSAAFCVYRRWAVNPREVRRRHTKPVATRRDIVQPEVYTPHGPSASVVVASPEGRPRGRRSSKCVYVGAEAPFVGVGYSQRDGGRR